MVGTLVPGPVCSQVVRHCRPSDLRTARRTTTLRPLWPLLCRLMSLPFPLRRRLRCPSGLFTERRLTLVPASVAAATTFRHTRFRSGSGYCPLALGHYPVVPSVTGVPVVDAFYLAEFDSENFRTALSGSPVSDVVSVVPEDMLTFISRFAQLSPRVHWCLQRLWTGGLWSRRSFTLLSCLRICRPL